MSPRFCFGPFVLVPTQQLLLHGDAPVRIGSRAFEILAALVERPGELVTKEQLLARVWPDTAIQESNLKVNVAALRRALGDGGRYVAAVSGRGYRFVAPVQITRSWGVRAAISITELRGDEQARRLLEGLYADFSEGFETGDLRRARSLLAELRGPRRNTRELLDDN